MPAEPLATKGRQTAFDNVQKECLVHIIAPIFDGQVEVSSKDKVQVNTFFLSSGIDGAVQRIVLQRK